DGAGVPIAVVGMSEAEAQTPFANAVREKLNKSGDAQLLNAVGQTLLVANKAGTGLAYPYLKRAVQLNPRLIDARARLARIQVRQASPETGALLMRTDKEKKYQVISALPASERFVVLREMARYSYAEANSLEVINPDASNAARARSRTYAEDLLKL